MENNLLNNTPNTENIFHTHDGINSPKIDPNFFLPFPIYKNIPTDNAANGTMRLIFDGTNYRLYFRINNTWRYATLT